MNLNMNVNTRKLTRILRLDAAANVLAGLVLLAAAGWLAGPLGLGTAWPIRICGVALVVYGVENLVVARRTTSAGLAGLIAVDLVFAAAALGVAVADPTAADTWARWALVGVADLSAAFGIAKILGLRALGSRRPAGDAV